MSSHPEPDETLYPSRIAKTKIGVWIPDDEVRAAKVFCAVNDVTLQDLTAIGWRLAMAEIVETGRPVNQSTSQPLMDQELIPDKKTMMDTDPNITDQGSAAATGQPVNQVKPGLLEALRTMLSQQTLETWFVPLRARIEGGRLVMKAPNHAVQDWIESQYSEHLAKAAELVGAERVQWELPSAAAVPIDVLEVETEDPAKRAERLLNYYAVVTQNRVWPADITSFAKVAACTDEAIMCGILRSQISVAGGKMRKFEYCIKAIFQIHASGLAPRLVAKLEREWQQSLPGFSAEVIQLKRKE